MPLENNRFRSRLVPTLWLIAVPGLAALVMFAKWHLSSTSFWYDESMQFWMSLGLDGFGPPLLPPGSLRAALRNNALANLDPGGFTLILRYWLRLSTSEMWQRVLPFLFFALGIAGLGWIGWTQRKSALFAAFSCVVPTLFPLILNYATEVRAYSMEFAGIVIGCVLLDRLTTRPNTQIALLSGVTFGFFLTSRYSFALFTCAACVTLVGLGWIRRDSLPRRHIRQYFYLLYFFVPIFASGVLVFVLALWPEYKARISYNGGELIGYIVRMTTAGKAADEIARTLAFNLLHPAGLPVTIAAALGIVALLPERVRARLALNGFATAICRLGLAAFAILCLATLTITALLWHWHPWDITTKWSLWLQALSAVAIVRLAAALLANAGGLRAGGHEQNRVVAATLIVAVSALDLRLALYRRSDWPTFVPALAYLEQQALPDGSVAIEEHSYPSIRYFYEYGSFASSRHFPNAFRLPYWGAPQPLVVAQTHYLLTGLSLSSANAVFAPARIIRDPSLPDLLYRVEPAIANPAHD
jgi:hypothetical protein